jgi:hypothetical protein
MRWVICNSMIFQNLLEQVWCYFWFFTNNAILQHIVIEIIFGLLLLQWFRCSNLVLLNVINNDVFFTLIHFYWFIHLNDWHLLFIYVIMGWEKPWILHYILHWYSFILVLIQHLKYQILNFNVIYIQILFRILNFLVHYAFSYILSIIIERMPSCY